MMKPCLPQTSIGNMQQDRYGYLWMNTQYGIVRFDGKEFKTFTTGNTKGLSSNRIRLCASNNKAIYFLDENRAFLQVTSPNAFQITTESELYRNFVFPVWSSASCNDVLFLHLQSGPAYRHFINWLSINQRRETLKCYATGPEQGYFFYTDMADGVRICYYNNGQYSTQALTGSSGAGNTFSLGKGVFLQTSSSTVTLFNKGKETRNIPVIGLPSSINRWLAQENKMLFSDRSGTFLYAEGKLYEYKLHDSAITATLLFQNLPCIGVIRQLKSTVPVCAGLYNVAECKQRTPDTEREGEPAKDGG